MKSHMSWRACTGECDERSGRTHLMQMTQFNVERVLRSRGAFRRAAESYGTPAKFAVSLCFNIAPVSSPHVA